MLARLIGGPARFALAMLAITVAGLALDRASGLTGQTLLAGATWLILLAAVLQVEPIEQARTVVVVLVATCAEVIGSLLWGVYEYRLGNLPLFVPAGHGIVYLTGLMISRTALARRFPARLVGIAIVLVAGWGLVGLLNPARMDVAGAVGGAVLVVFLLRGRVPAVYAGVFLFVAFLEIYGTVLGTWTWAPVIPGLGVSNGNPPSGAGSGYVLFDIAALWLAPTVLLLAARGGRGLERARRALRPPREPIPAPVPDEAAG